MSCLRNAHLPPDRMFIDLGPSCPAPLRGFSHHGSSVTGGSFIRPLSMPSEPVVLTSCGMCAKPLPARRGPRGAEPKWCSQACCAKASRDRRREA